MKKLFTLALLGLLTLGCKQGEKQDNPIKEEPTGIAVSQVFEQSEALKKISSELLIPMELVEPNAKEVTTKYGLEFGGNCYACDVANILIDGEMITLMNACDLNSQISFIIESVEEQGQQINIRTKLHTFVFEQVDDYPVYSLKVIGEELDESIFREGAFYTLRSLLQTFEVHDCEDFEG
ncbi:hypothetical protein [Myroides sp. DF42-4-2]|uniref:hypothetical protein n=1 Tax=unclassified Myroides TaxID=2642485 RepID=UPI002577AF8F|nr:hypothetical protein [Myroides sp. DF42-4-2]MDM1408073.1 hypothetical protein [Myroides sp. DF42-4-2]